MVVEVICDGIRGGDEATHGVMPQNAARMDVTSLTGEPRAIASARLRERHEIGR